jgi:hypothetical protein
VSVSASNSIYQQAALDVSMKLSMHAYVMSIFLIFTIFVGFIINTYSIGMLRALPAPTVRPFNPLFIGGVLGASLALLAVLLVGVSFQSAAVTLRQPFIANVAICRPVLSADQEKDLLSRFAGMRTRSDFEAVDRKLRDIATQHGITAYLWPAE